MQDVTIHTHHRWWLHTPTCSSSRRSARPCWTARPPSTYCCGRAACARATASGSTSRPPRAGDASRSVRLMSLIVLVVVVAVGGVSVVVLVVDDGVASCCVVVVVTTFQSISPDHYVAPHKAPLQVGLEPTRPIGLTTIDLCLCFLILFR